jgi:hypothetical protein
MSCTGQKPLAVLVLAGLALSQVACVSGIARNQSDLEHYLSNNLAAEALEVVELRRRVSRNESIYLLDKAMLLRMQQQFEASNTAFEQAKDVIEELDAISLREQAAAVTINDSMRSYLPPTFERVLIHCFKAMNFLELRQYDDARVEVLQLDEFLKQEDDFRLPFARYLSGLVFEFNQEPDNALIAYRKAYEAYRDDGGAIPGLLQKDLLRLTDYLGRVDEHRRFDEEFALLSWPTQQRFREQAHVVAILFNGLIPRKHSHEILAQSPSDGRMHRISTPFYEQRYTRVHSAMLASDLVAYDSELFADLERHARAALEDDMPGIIARTVARVAVKNRAVDEASEEAPLFGLALNVLAVLSEQADTRGWYTLPQEIMVTRLELEPGLHDLRLLLDGSSGLDASQSWQRIELEPGKTVIFGLHWPESYSTLGRRYR